MAHVVKTQSAWRMAHSEEFFMRILSFVPLALFV